MRGAGHDERRRGDAERDFRGGFLERALAFGGVQLDADGQVIAHDVELQTRSVIENIKAVLEGALKVMPELKRTSEPIQTGVAPTNGGNAIAGDEDALRKAMGLPPKK